MSSKCGKLPFFDLSGVCFPLYSCKRAGYTEIVRGLIHAYFSSAHPPSLLPIRVEATSRIVLETSADPFGSNNTFRSTACWLVLC
jgi:hypothetical protein